MLHRSISIPSTDKFLNLLKFERHRQTEEQTRELLEEIAKTVIIPNAI